METAAPLSAGTGRPAADRVFYTTISAVIALIVFAGFTRSWFLSAWFDPPDGTPAVGPLLITHGLVFTAWLMLSVVQPTLIAARHPALHRRLGYTGAVLACLMVLLGNVVAIAAIHVGYLGLGDPYAFYAIPFFDLQVFALFVGLAIANRRKPETHKRLMLLSSTQILEAGMARLPIDVFQAGMPYSSLFGVDFVIVAGILYDAITRHKIHPVWIWGGGIVVFSEALRLAVQGTAPWLAFARFMATLYVP